MCFVAQGPQIDRTSAPIRPACSYFPLQRRLVAPLKCEPVACPQAGLPPLGIRYDALRRDERRRSLLGRERYPPSLYIPDRGNRFGCPVLSSTMSKRVCPTDIVYATRSTFFSSLSKKAMKTGEPAKTVSPDRGSSIR